MMLSVRRVGTVAALVAALAPLMAATNCTDSELTETETAYTEYGTTLDTDCSPNACSAECVATMSTLADHLPDCEYSDGINYYEGLLESVDLCAQDASGSTSDSVSSDSGSSFSSSSSESTSESESGTTCSASELTVTETYVANYTDAMATDCDSDPCSSACIVDMTALAAVLPDCEYSDGINYYDDIVTSIELCSDSLSASGSVGSGVDECSTSESSNTAQYLATYDAQYTKECTTDECSSGCLEVLDKLVGVLPDCVDSDGINYYEGIQLMIDTCGSASASESDSTGSSNSGSSSRLFSASSTTSDASVASESGSNAASTSAAAAAALSAALTLAAASLVL